jgi:hypothetical protein
MNKLRRADIDRVILKLDSLREEIKVIAHEERTAFDNLSEGLQSSERGEAMDKTATDLEQTADAIAAAIHKLIRAKEAV